MSGMRLTPGWIRRLPRFRLRTLLIAVALVAVLLDAERIRRRWASYRERARYHASYEQFCRDSAGTFRCPEHWDPATAESAAREAEKHARLRRFYEGRW